MDLALPTTPSGWHKRVLTLTWPLILANLTIPLVGVADVAVMGRLPSPIYIGAVSVGAVIFSSMYWIFGFLRTGTTGLVAQAYGGRDPDMVVGTFARAVVIAIVLGCAMVLAQWPVAALMFALFEASAEVESLARSYFDIRIFGAPGLLIYLAEMGLLFGLQRMRDTLLLSVGLNVTNLTLDVVLVLGFGMGVEGVAYGTIISEWGAAAFGAFLVMRAVTRAGFEWRLPTDLWQRDKIAQLFHVGSNLILRTLFVQLPFFIGTLLAARLGDTTLALHGVLMQLFFVMTYGIDGFSHTAETLAGFTFGSRNKDQLRKACYYCAIWGFAVGAVMGFIYFASGNEIVALLTVSPEVRAAAAEYLPWIAVAPLFCAGAFLFDGIFIGTTHIVEMRNSMIVASALWALILWLVFEPWGYHGVWFAMIAFMALRTGLLGSFYPRIEKHASSVTL